MTLSIKYWILILVWLPFISSAQYKSIQGYIYDDSGDPIYGAVINLSNTNNKFKTGFATDTSGQYRFDSLAAGIYSIRVNYVGYEENLMTGIDLMNNALLEVNVNMVKRWEPCHPSPIYIDAEKTAITPLMSIKDAELNVNNECKITGCVRGPEGKAVKNVVITAYSNDSAIAYTNSDEKGCYQLRLQKDLKKIKLNYYAKYEGKKRHKYLYPAIILRNVNISQSNINVDITLKKRRYERCPVYTAY